jgi:hypothetical protein
LIRRNKAFYRPHKLRLINKLWHAFRISVSKRKLQIMKRFLAVAVIAMLAMFTSVNSFAQQGDQAARQAQMKQKLMTDLKMTDVQADSVVAISASYMPQRRAIFQDQSLSQDDKQAKMKAITDEADKRIHPILGDPLFQQYQDWRTKNMQQMRSGKPANG